MQRCRTQRLNCRACNRSLLSAFHPYALSTPRFPINRLYPVGVENENDGRNDDYDDDNDDDNEDAPSSRTGGNPDRRLSGHPCESHPSKVAQLPSTTSDETSDSGGTSGDDSLGGSGGIVGEHWPHPPCALQAAAAGGDGDGSVGDDGKAGGT